MRWRAGSPDTSQRTPRRSSTGSWSVWRGCGGNAVATVLSIIGQSFQVCDVWMGVWFGRGGKAVGLVVRTPLAAPPPHRGGTRSVERGRKGARSTDPAN